MSFQNNNTNFEQIIDNCTHNFIDDDKYGSVLCNLCGLVPHQLFLDDTQEYRSFEKNKYHYEKTQNEYDGDEEFWSNSNSLKNNSNYKLKRLGQKRKHAIQLLNECDRYNVTRDYVEVKNDSGTVSLSK